MEHRKTSQNHPKRAKTSETTHVFAKTIWKHSLFFKIQVKPAKKYFQKAL